MRILIIEDERDMAETLRDGLSGHYSVDIAGTGKEGLYQAQINDYDLLILDLGLPDIEGQEVCRSLREAGIGTPILILTGSGEIAEKVKALDNGADDYLTKPFSLEELSARIRALLRRSPDTKSSNSMVVGDLILDPIHRTVTRRGRVITLRRKEFDLLEYLLRNEGRVVTRSMIIDHIWSEGAELFTNVVDVHIKYLRDRVDRPFGSQLIQTVHGLGYKITKGGGDNE